MQHFKMMFSHLKSFAVVVGFFFLGVCSGPQTAHAGLDVLDFQVGGVEELGSSGAANYLLGFIAWSPLLDLDNTWAVRGRIGTTLGVGPSFFTAEALVEYSLSHLLLFDLGGGYQTFFPASAGLVGTGGVALRLLNTTVVDRIYAQYSILSNVQEINIGIGFKF